MKKCFLALLALIMLCGCQRTKSDYLVSSMGFDYKNGQFYTCFEAVISNSETDEQSVKLIKGKGETIEKSVEEIKKQCTQKLLLSHCGAVIVGESVPQKQLEQIYEYCFNNADITLSTLCVETENAEKLLSQKPISTIAVGYDILNLTEQISESKNEKIKTRYFEIMAQNKKTNLPKIKLTKEGYYFESY